MTANNRLKLSALPIGANQAPATGNTRWWNRSRAQDNNLRAGNTYWNGNIYSQVVQNGAIGTFSQTPGGNEITINEVGIRPALWIHTSAIPR